MKNAERHSNNTCTNINPRMVQAHCLKRLKSSFTYALNRNVLIEMKKKYIYIWQHSLKYRFQGFWST